MHKKLRVKISLTIKGQTIRALSCQELSEVAGGSPNPETKGASCGCQPTL
jgi:hypothetical protein